jgi:hypothetical protein
MERRTRADPQWMEVGSALADHDCIANHNAILIFSGAPIGIMSGFPDRRSRAALAGGARLASGSSMPPFPTDYAGSGAG